MTSSFAEPAVLLIDLRDTPADDGELRVFDVLHNHRWLASSQVLVVDDAATLVDHYSVYRAIQRTGLRRRVICVAVGAPASRVRSEAIRATRVLDNDQSLTLWVGDPDGVQWPSEPAPGMPAGVTRQPGLRTLLDVLLIPEVFNAVIDLANAFPSRTACPGHLVLTGRVGLDDLDRAQRTAVAAVAGRANEEHTAVTAEQDFWGVVGLPPDGPVAERLHTGGHLDKKYRDCVQQCRQATRSVHGLVGPLGPPLRNHAAGAWTQVSKAGDALGELRGLTIDLFQRIDGRVGLSQATRDELERNGVHTGEPPDADRLSIINRMQEHLVASLRRGHSLTFMAGWLRGLANQAVPAGSAARVDRLDAACPRGLVERMRRPPDFPWRPDAWWALTAAMVCAALAGLGPFGLITGPVLVVAWVAAITLAAVRRPRPPRAADAVPSRAAALHTVAAVGGCAIGILLPIAIGVNVPAWLGAAATILAAAVLVVVLRLWWVDAVLTWRDAVVAHRGADAARALHRELNLVATQEWALSQARRFTADAALAMSIAVQEVADAMRGTQAARPAPPSTAIGMDLLGIVSRDLSALAVEALRPCWQRLTQGTVGEVRAGLRDRVYELLDDYRKHLESQGVDQRPVFVPDEDDRAALTKAIWQETPEVDLLVQGAPAAARMAQLCSADDLPLLDHTEGRMRLIRFAPRAALQAIGERRPSGYGSADVIWTATGHLAGVLRLVPLRDNAVTLTWPVQTGGKDQS